MLCVLHNSDRGRLDIPALRYSDQVWNQDGILELCRALLYATLKKS